MNKKEYLIFLIENAPYDRRENLKKYLEINIDNEMLIFDLYILSKININIVFDFDTTKYISYDFVHLSLLSAIWNKNEVDLEFKNLLKFENFKREKSFIRNILNSYIEQCEEFIKTNNVVIGKNFCNSITVRYDITSKNFNGFYLRVKFYKQ